MGSRIALGSFVLGGVLVAALTIATGALVDELAAPTRTGDVGIGRVGGGRCELRIAEESAWTDTVGAAALGLAPQRGERVLETSCAVLATALAPSLTHAQTCLRSTWRPSTFPDPLAATPCP